MPRELILHPLAEQELDEAADYYESRSLGLANRYYGEVEAFAGKILANPLRYAIRVANVRRANLKHFPYSLNYFLHGDAIVAIAHHRQRPFYWRGRLKDQDWLGQK